MSSPLAATLAKRHRIFVCSDWHLGGDPDAGARIGSQICRSASALTSFIDWVAGEAVAFDGLTEIVINGDMVDFLAPATGSSPLEWIADQSEVIRRLDRIIESARAGSGRGPFEALADFLHLEQAAVTLLLGNHDIELSLPRVRQHLESILDPKLRFIYDGEALVRGPVLIEHGNRYDPWNAVDHSRLRQERSHVARGLPIIEKDRDKRLFRAPAGTYLVVHGINSVLAKYPFINLLKPENEAAVPLLLTLEPELRGVLGLALSLSPVTVGRRYQSRLVDATTPAQPGNMTGADAVSVEIKTMDQALTALLGADAGLFVSPTPVSPMGSSGVIDRAQALWQRSREVSAAIATRLDLATVAASAVDAFKFRQIEVAFQSLQGDRTFALATESPGYLNAATAMLGTGQFDVIIFGHTHLPKRIEVPRAGKSSGMYLNTGTWADVIRLPAKACEASADGKTARRDFLTDMASHRIQPYLFTSLGYAEVELSGDKLVSCDLRSYTSADPRSAPMTSFR